MFDSKMFWLCAIAGCKLLLIPKSKSSIFKLYLGYAYEKIGKLNLAYKVYSSLLNDFKNSNDIKVFRWMHVVTFYYERIKYLLGEADVFDPLFYCDIIPKKLHNKSKKSGYYATEFSFSGLKIFGFTNSKVDKITIYINNTPVKVLNTSNNGKRIREFSFSFKRNTVLLFPKIAILTLKDKDDNLLFAFGKFHQVEIRVTHGKDMLIDLILSGKTIDKKGYFLISNEIVRKRQDQYLSLYLEAESFFKKEFDKSIFIFYGTLLGVFRNGDLIPSDDDFDVGYISSNNSPGMVKKETLNIIERLILNGFSVSFNRRGRLFRLHSKENFKRDIHLDIRPIWFEGEYAFAHNHLYMASRKQDFLPVTTKMVRNSELKMPKNSKKFLEHYYGPNWITPDPGFMFYLSDVDKTVIKTLSKTNILPQEFKIVKNNILSSMKNQDSCGSFISVGLEELYPLTGNTENE